MAETVILLVVGLFCGMIPGFWLGRFSAKYYVGENGVAESEENAALDGGIRGGEPAVGQDASAGRAEEAKIRKFGPQRYDKRRIGEAGMAVISSPVSGNIIDYSDGKRPEIVLNPDEEKLYAPAGGKIIKLFPLGNEMLFRTEEGIVLRIKVGEKVDELQSEYFRPKVIQNEVMNRGKLLLEFDRRSLEAEGVDCQLSVRVEDFAPGERVAGVAEGCVKAGEAIFEIAQK